MTQQVDFKEISNRDAWSTIRGFVYQVDHTILRWLKLQDDEMLELERGEDIDLIKQSLSLGEIRLLEQIKYREDSITLNTDVIIELLRNFYEHKQNNPKKVLRFRFVTNAKYGQERPAIFAKGEKGIDIWIALQHPETDWNSNDRIDTLKAHIQKKIDEQILSGNKLTAQQITLNEGWTGFRKYLENLENLKSFILDFEWATIKEDQTSIIETIYPEIQKHFNTSDPRPFYERMFLFVFKLLSRKGQKRLELAMLDQMHVSEPSSYDDQQLIAMIKSLLENVDRRLEALYKKVEDHDQKLDKVFNDLQLLQNDTVVKFRIRNISTNVPQTIKNGTVRTEKVKIVEKFLELFPCVAFHGINGCGKTQLAALVSRNYQNAFWLDLREYNGDLQLSATALEVFLGHISQIPFQTDKKNWMELVLSVLPKGCLLIINDIPKLDGSVPAVNDLLCHLVNGLESNNLRLITTSNFIFPDTLVQKCPEECIFVFNEFEFNDEELKEYLKNQGAPKEFLKMLPFVAARAHRNPRLTTAMINHLKSINWGADSNAMLETVLNTEFASGILEDAQLSINKYISDEGSRELLYRLSLISWGFTIDQVHAVCSVEKKISHPKEKLQPLLHLWIQLSSNNQFLISPIIQNIGQHNLSGDILKKVYVSIAKSIIDGKNLNQDSAYRAFMAFLNGKDYEGAGVVLLKIFQATRLPEEGKLLFMTGLQYFWTNTDFPVDMGIGLKITIRQEQLRIYSLMGEDLSKLLEHTKTIFVDQKATIIQLAAARLMFITTYFRQLPVLDYVSCLKFVLQHLDELNEIRSTAEGIDIIPELIWLPIMTIKNLAELEAWIEIADLATFKGVNIYTSEIKEIAINNLCQQIVNRQLPELDDDDSIAMLNKLLKFFELATKQVLFAYPARSLAELESKWYNDTSNAVYVAKKYLENLNYEKARFVLSSQIGRFYRELRERESEIEWFRAALQYKAPEPIEHIDILMSGSVAVTGTDRREALVYCQKAVQVAKDIPSYEENDYILLLDELAVAYWLVGDLEGTYSTLEEIVNRLFNAKTGHFDSLWIRLFTLTAHMATYCAVMVSEGIPPKTGGEDFFEPFQGMFNNYKNDFSSRYQHKHDSYIFVQLADFAASLGKTESAYKWSLKAFDMARSSGSQGIFKTISTVSAHFAIINYKPVEAFEAYLYNGAVLSHLKGTPQERDELLESLNSTDYLTNKPSREWADAEDTATTYAVIPLFIMLLTAVKENKINRNQMRASYFKMLLTYQSSASDTLLFELLIEISTNILDNKISLQMLTDRANTFGHQGRHNLQRLCIFGYIHLTNRNDDRLLQIINIVPQTQNILYVPRPTLNQFTLVPFVKSNIVEILKGEFVGSKEELAELEQRLSDIDQKDRNCIRDMINLARELIEPNIPEDRKRWLSGEDI